MVRICAPTQTSKTGLCPGITAPRNPWGRRRLPDPPRRVGSHQPRRRSLGFTCGSPRGKRTTRRDLGAGNTGRGLRPSHRLPVARILPQPLHRGSRAGLSPSAIVLASGSHGATIRAPLRGPASPTDSSCSGSKRSARPRSRGHARCVASPARSWNLLTLATQLIPDPRSHSRES